MEYNQKDSQDIGQAHSDQGNEPQTHPHGQAHTGHSGGHPTGQPGGHKSHMAMPMTLEDGTPACKLVAWEVTRACNLACKHCRASAMPNPFPGELSHEEAMNLLQTFPQIGKPIIIFTGGEPLMRKDLFELIKATHDLGLICALSPNGTLITKENAKLIRESGVDRCSISIDGPDALSHDSFRGLQGAFDASLRGIEYLKEQGIEFQINTTVSKANLDNFKRIFELCEKLGASAWHIFLLVPTGRGADIADLSINAAEYEKILHWFYDFRKTTSMHLKATCAPHYYRIMRQRAKEDGVPVTPQNFAMDALTRGCLAGTGFCFISHSGQLQPCGYLELNCGNIRETPLPELWRKTPYFVKFRDQQAYSGKCGICEYHKVCGGCRARAYTLKGDHMAEEPLCSFTPTKMKAV